MGEKMVSLPLKQTSAETTVEIQNKLSISTQVTNLVRDSVESFGEICLFMVVKRSCKSQQLRVTDFHMNA